jgi:hypothetical protein
MVLSTGHASNRQNLKRISCNDVPSSSGSGAIEARAGWGNLRARGDTVVLTTEFEVTGIPARDGSNWLTPCCNFNDSFNMSNPATNPPMLVPGTTSQPTNIPTNAPILSPGTTSQTLIPLAVLPRITSQLTDPPATHRSSSRHEEQPTRPLKSVCRHSYPIRPAKRCTLR